MLVLYILGYFCQNKQNSYAALKSDMQHPNKKCKKTNIMADLVKSGARGPGATIWAEGATTTVAARARRTTTVG